MNRYVKIIKSNYFASVTTNCRGKEQNFRYQYINTVTLAHCDVISSTQFIHNGGIITQVTVPVQLCELLCHYLIFITNFKNGTDRLAHTQGRDGHRIFGRC